MKIDQDFGWLDESIDELLQFHSEYLQGSPHNFNVILKEAKAAIQVHFTTMVHPSTSRGYMLGFEAGKREQAKQHQADLLRARIDELQKVILYVSPTTEGLSDTPTMEFRYLEDRIKELEHEV